MAGNDWARLREQVSARMLELGIPDQAGLIEATGLSAPTVRGIMEGNHRSSTVRARTQQQLDVGLRWARGSTVAVLAGGEPVALDANQGGGGVSSLDDVDALRRAVQQLQQRADVTDARVFGIEEALERQVRQMVEALGRLVDQAEGQSQTNGP